MMHTNLADHHHVPMATRCVYDSLKRCCPTGKSRCQVSYKTLADLSGYSRSTVIQAIEELTLRRWLKKEVRQEASQGFCQNRYRLLK